MSIFYSGSLISGAFGSLIAAGILNGLAGRQGLSAWQWLYIIEGSITVALGILVMCVLPDFPQTWKLLSPEMRHVGELVIFQTDNYVANRFVQQIVVWQSMPRKQMWMNQALGLSSKD